MPQLEKIRLSITRLKPPYSDRFRFTYHSLEKIRLSITRLKLGIVEDIHRVSELTWKDKTLDYEIETVLPIFDAMDKKFNLKR